MGGEVLGHSHRQPPKGRCREGIILNMEGVLRQLRLSNLTDLVKMFIFHGFEPPGCRKSDFWSKNDSFWWGERLRTSKIRLFHILDAGLRSQVSGLKSQVSGLWSQVSGLGSLVSGLWSQVSGLLSAVSGLRCYVSGCRWLVSGLIAPE